MIEDYKPNFKIICTKCGSEEIVIRSDVGYSPQSGGWGAVSLKCTKCRNETDIWSAS